MLQDIHALNAELEAFEKKYSVLSEDFYRLYVAGELRDEDVDEIDEYGAWAAAYKMKMRRLDIYRQLWEEYLQSLRAGAPAGEIALPSVAVLVRA